MVKFDDTVRLSESVLADAARWYTENERRIPDAFKGQHPLVIAYIQRRIEEIPGASWRNVTIDQAGNVEIHDNAKWRM